MPYAELRPHTPKRTLTGAEEAAALQNANQGPAVSTNPFANLQTGGGFQAQRPVTPPQAMPSQSFGGGSGGGGGAAAFQGLQAALPPAAPEPAADETGGMAAMMAAMGGQEAEPTNLFLPGTPGVLRQGMGNRIYPMDVPSQGLSRAY